ncbi:hypothetical protein [Stenotrophomonas sp. Nf1]|uniref:hypothetical protein n=2 Tax=unclassified Stenotrophomonas TaxID=196198 RepID=UPI0011B27352|nr:hypothetical protein [Stenotrophomonas sp. Nf1]
MLGGPLPLPCPLMYTPALTLLLCAPFACAAATPAALSLEATFDAHARIITQNDEAARAALRGSLRGADPEEYPEIAGIVDSLYAFEHLATGFDDAAATAIRTRQQSIQCRADRITEDATSTHGSVDYHCVFPDVSIAFEAYRDHLARSRDRAQRAGALRSFLAIYAATLRDAPDARFTARAEFSRVGGNGPWASADMLQVGVKLLEALMPFSDWDERIEADARNASEGGRAGDDQ